MSFGPPAGSQNGLKHGRYAAEAIATRRALRSATKATVAAAKRIAAAQAPKQRRRRKPRQVIPDGTPP